ncbi:DNA-directed RNA polymerase subunit delta [Brevibacillus laterosporus]|uniref:Probable DNA-directed RNA polymerase subunit delta n=1 Tax=Brevibacillus laterosporus TaxID=1465 RepID=A0AAP3DCB6_BRELA|nr:DNA-directed RNA polymerase subunit delta [Brevibacillus laterosporus]MCR8978290.1 DNA-directed RNA polymerase subunit delta [Brevibacillus laterosporus]MCZ0805446.1 DNA-directed RNA polymerase subunit delta [Brevibacillus laterosporus]MCZ0823986.1 DNA-directed RNA polymerase subunit delta [Brevibacillus laterosporus]MCZ0848888.1 DNA-directed RNA polymerase subunit delta [Brevibacillus laterosporus]MED1662516.1 DNA-directed RNA polymerase subunit delta [Brevibacillus laterosporus]
MSKLLQQYNEEKLQEMAMVDIAYEILRETNRPYNFRELMNEIAILRKLTEEQLMAVIAQVYTEVNIDGRFVCIGENTWGLKRWYATEAVEESQEGGVKKKKAAVVDDFEDFDMEDDVAEVFEEEDDISLFEEEEEEDEDFVDEEEVDSDDEIEDIDEEDEDLEDEDLFEEDEETEGEEEEDQELDK